MARVNVDSQALTDARFAVLANLMGSDDPDYALGRMVRVWMQCLERETYAITKPVIVALFRGAVDAPAWLVQSELAEDLGDSLRIKGTKGRIEYLSEKRAKARANGSKGGRPRKQIRKPTLVSDGNLCRSPMETPPAPAPAPALKEEEEPPYPPRGGTDLAIPVPDCIPDELNTPEFLAAWAEWKAERAAKRIRPYTARGEREQWKKLAAFGSPEAVAAIRESIAQGWQGLFPGKGQRHGKSSSTDYARETLLDAIGAVQ